MSTSKKTKKSEKRISESHELLPLTQHEDIISSLRFKVLFALSKACAWLVIGLCLYCLSIILLLYPVELFRTDVLTYGRLQASAFTAIVYGFLLQGLSAVIIYFSCKSANTSLKNGFSFYIGYGLWNVGVLVGIIAIVFGHNSGYEYFEMPHFSLWMLIIASLFISYTAIMISKDFVSSPLQTYGVGFCVSMLLAMCVAYLFLIRFPTMGVGQIIIHNWVKNILLNICIGGWLLGLLYYFVSDIIKTPSYIIYLTYFGLLLFGGAGGISPSIPVPRWVYELNKSLSFLMTVPVLAFFMTTFISVSRAYAMGKPLEFFDKTIFFAVVGITLYYVLFMIKPVLPVAQMVEFTVYEQGKDLCLLVCAALSVFYIAAQKILKDVECLDFSSAFKKTIYLSCICSVIISVSYVIGGILQGSRLYDYRILFIDVISIIQPIHYLIFACLILLSVSVSILFIKCSLVYLKALVRRTIELRDTYIAEIETQHRDA